MANQDIKADYTCLAEVAAGFGREAERVRAILSGLQEKKSALATSWQGQGARAFAQDMETAVLPSFQRLVTALQEAGTTLTTLSRVFQTAEEEAARLVQRPALIGGESEAAVGPFVPIQADQPTPTPTPTGTPPPDDPRQPPPGVVFTGPEVPSVLGPDNQPYPDQFLPGGTADGKLHKLCGPFCVTACLNALGIPCKIDDLIKYFGLDGAKEVGASSANLLQYLEYYDTQHQLITSHKSIASTEALWQDLATGTSQGKVMFVPILIPGKDGPVDHWVMVTAVGMAPPKYPGDPPVPYVRVYDPLCNAITYRKWDDFKTGVVLKSDRLQMVTVSKKDS